MSTEEKTKKTKLEETEESKRLDESDHLKMEEKSSPTSVELRLPSPVNQHDEDSSSVAAHASGSSKLER